MLSSIGRAAIRRSAAGAGPRASTIRVSQSIWHVRTFIVPVGEPGAGLPLKPSSGRCYATATKTATKPAAKATKSKIAAVKPAKKSVKKAAKKKPAKKAAAKPKAKKPVKKPAKKANKVLTDAQKEKLAASKKRKEIKALKETALTPPKRLPRSAHEILFAESVRTEGRKPTEAPHFASEKLKSLDPAELESYNHQANQNVLANEAAYKKWVESHTPDQIRLANNARKLLRTKLGKRGGWTLIEDARLPKRAPGPHLLYFKDRLASGDFKNIKITDAVKLIFTDWRTLSASEKKIYEDRSASDKQRYLLEYKTVYGRDAPTAKASST